MIRRLRQILSILLLITAASATAEEINESEPKPYNEILLGYGTSHPGWGDTDHRVQTADFVFRHCRPFFQKNEGWIKGDHEFWIEVPASFIVGDSTGQNSDDIGFFGLNFLFAWVFPETNYGSPYFMIGGGPVYVAADIDGVGSDVCGNYQMGGGFRLNAFEDRPISLELRYHHISNLNMTSPNVALNSTKIYCGLTLPF